MMDGRSGTLYRKSLMLGSGDCAGCVPSSELSGPPPPSQIQLRRGVVACVRCRLVLIHSHMPLYSASPRPLAVGVNMPVNKRLAFHTVDNVLVGFFGVQYVFTFGIFYILKVPPSLRCDTPHRYTHVWVAGSKQPQLLFMVHKGHGRRKADLTLSLRSPLGDFFSGGKSNTILRSKRLLVRKYDLFRGKARRAGGRAKNVRGMRVIKMALCTRRCVLCFVFCVCFFYTNVATGGRKYQAAAQGVQQEVEDIRGELVKLLKTLNSTRVDILGAENELQKKVNISVLFVPFDFMVRHDTPCDLMPVHAVTVMSWWQFGDRVDECSRFPTLACVESLLIISTPNQPPV